ncbi:HAD family phosphatase [Natrarchaeobius halalkaliphilus]|uniref:HAD family phosphatase n=1 Tax=Natrarchaeobius halalkaliphilus TaxID=1679091 RepID=A0A3N6NUB3_9EURY|nr:HAD family phosphatase [Natrarchaeobius halalkaliphilus]RQG86740.1 HAD family phosphatase [Natrarchaeobius halalkaliphilus]
MTRAVLFDMDGVLVDSEPHWKRYWQTEVFPEAVDGEPTLEDVTGRNFRESLVALDETYGLPGGPDRFEAEVEAFAERMYRERATVTEGMPALVSSLQDRVSSFGIVSSSPRRWITLVVDRSDLSAPDVIVSAEDIEAPGKPDPAIYEHALERLDVDPFDALVVEDSIHGARAASRAGTTVVRYEYGGDPEPIPEAEYVADDLPQLRTLLFELSADD